MSRTDNPILHKGYFGPLIVNVVDKRGVAVDLTGSTAVSAAITPDGGTTENPTAAVSGASTGAVTVTCVAGTFPTADERYEMQLRVTFADRNPATRTVRFPVAAVASGL